MSPTVTIRPMHPDDADAVRELDVQAFATYFGGLGRNEPTPPRTRENILACLALDPGGCFVAEASSPVGFIFGRRWGGLGWIGVFCVHPDRQGQGVGRRLLSRAVEHLEAVGCGLIGLETMPGSTYNVGFYARSGFRPTHTTLIVEKAVQMPPGGPPAALLSQLDRGPALAAVTEVSQAALSGLDYAVEASNAAEFGWGETLLVAWPDPWAVAIVRTAAKREGPARAVADVAALAIRGGARSRLPEALQVLEAFAGERGLEQVRLAVNAADWATAEALLARGFRVSHLGLRLLGKGEYACPPAVELSRWAM